MSYWTKQLPLGNWDYSHRWHRQDLAKHFQVRCLRGGNALTSPLPTLYNSSTHMVQFKRESSVHACPPLGFSVTCHFLPPRKVRALPEKKVLFIGVPVSILSPGLCRHAREAVRDMLSRERLHLHQNFKRTSHSLTMPLCFATTHFLFSRFLFVCLLFMKRWKVQDSGSSIKGMSLWKEEKKELETGPAVCQLCV